MFVKRVNNFGLIEEDVYETAHLEILPPRQRSGVQDLSSQDADGLWRITCLNTQKNILLYNNDGYWNKKLKADFLNSVTIDLVRNSTSGTRAIMVIIEPSRRKEILNSEKILLALLIRKHYQLNDIIEINLSIVSYLLNCVNE